MATVMGVLNVTPDSFSDGGRFGAPDAAIVHGAELFEAGARVVDVGGESTRPGSLPVEVEAERDRVVPVVRALAPLGTVSVDTTKWEIAVEAVQAGATIVNDVGGQLADVAGSLGVAYVAMHSAGPPVSMQDDPRYDDVVAEVLDHVLGLADAATAAGSPHVWIDPGIGFGKTIGHNLALLAALDEFVATGWPVLIGHSRKSFLGNLLAKSDGIAEVATDDRLEGSLAVATWAASVGVDMIRMHDVAEAVQAMSVVGMTAEGAQ